MDGRKLDQLETLAWRREHGLPDDKLDDYFFTSKALALLARFKAQQSRVESGVAGTDGTVAESGGTKNGICGNAVAAVTATAVTDSQTPHQQQAAGRPGPKSRKEQEERKAMLTAELVNLTAFVTSHHPDDSDSGCHCKDNDPRNEKWCVNEARLFAHALEHYGKNFGAIKKAMPWKPAKSLIDHYYKTADGPSDADLDTGSDGPDLSPNNNEADATSPLFSKTEFPTSQLQVATCFTTNERFEGQSINWKKLKGNGQQVPHQKNGSSGGNASSDDTVTRSQNSVSSNSLTNGANQVVGAEIKPVKAKPIFPSEESESVANGNSLLGSLKFFMDGQLVLKLNANQQESDKKCHWVESQDTPRNVRSVRNKKYKTSKSGNNGTMSTDAASVSGETCSSKASEDTGDEESSDDESLDSESRSLPSPAAVSDAKSLPAAATASRVKSKVKVETNCQVPVATSAQLMSLSPTPALASDRKGHNNHNTNSRTESAPTSAAVASATASSAASAAGPTTTAATPATTSAKRVPDFSAFPFDDQQTFAEKKVRKRLKPSPACTNHNRLNHVPVVSNHGSSSSSSPASGLLESGVLDLSVKPVVPSSVRRQSSSRK